MKTESSHTRKLLPQTAGQTWWKRSYCRQRLAMTANGWSKMVEEELLPPTAGTGMTANGWSGTPAPAWPLANDDFALLPLLVHLFSRALVHVEEENLRQVGDEDVAGFIRNRKRLAR